MPDRSSPTILAFDTAGAALSVAVCEGQRVLAALHEPLRRGHAELLLPAIDGVLHAAGRKLADLDAIATTVGPGSFTGLRTGLAAAQGLAFASGLPLVGVDRFSALAAATVVLGQKPLVIAFDSRARTLYVQAYRADGSRPPCWPAAGRNLSPEEAAEELAEAPPEAGWLVAGEGAPALLAAGFQGQDTGMRALTATQVAAVALAELAAGGTGWPPQPLYLAPPRAVLPKDGGRLRARRT